MEQALSLSNNTHIYQHNDLIRLPLRMGNLETLIFVEALRLIRQGDNGSKDFPPIDIPITAIIGKQDSSLAYSAIEKACKELVTKQIDFGTDNTGKKKKRFRTLNIMASLEHEEGSNHIRGTFNPQIAPWLLQLHKNGNFSSAEIAILLTFRSPNTQRLYWILKSYSGMGKDLMYCTQIEINLLKLWLFASNEVYESYGEFKRSVLDVVFNEFREVNYEATWNPVKTGRKVTAIKFNIPRQHHGDIKPALINPVVDIKEVSISPKDNKFETFLEGLTGKNAKNLREVFHKVTDPKLENMSLTTAKSLYRYIAGKEGLEDAFLSARHHAQVNNQKLSDKNVSRKTYIISAMELLGFKLKP